MDYMGNLRKLVGKQPLIMVGANVIVENAQGQILMHHRTDKDWWGLPGGGMELGESLEETAIREVHEEVNLNVDELKLFNVYSGQDLHYIYPDGNEVYNVTATYICQSYEGDIIVEKTEGRDAKFFDIDQLPTNLSSTIVRILDDYIDYRKKNNDI